MKPTAVLVASRVSTFGLIVALALLPWPTGASSAQAEDFIIFGGSGGGGGGSNAASGGDGGEASANGGGGGNAQLGGGGGGEFYLLDGTTAGGTAGGVASGNTGGSGGGTNLGGGGNFGAVNGGPGTSGTAGGGGGGGVGYAGGGFGTGGAGGGGSAYSHTMASTSYDNVAIAGGHGGAGGNSVDWVGGGGGGGGGSVTVTASGDLTVNSLSITGGNGGGGGNSQNLMSSGTSGSGGAAGGGGGGGTSNGNSGNHSSGGGGGGGGNAALSVTGALVVNGTLSLASGTSGSNGTGGPAPGFGGAGGGASLAAGTLSAGTVDLKKQHGAFSFTVDKLIVNLNQSTDLKLNNTLATDVAIKGLEFSGGSSLAVTQANGGAMTFAGSLSVTGSGNTLSTPIQYDASDVGKSLDFNVTGLGAGGIALDLTGTQGVKVDATNTAINLTGASDIGLGQRAEFLNGAIDGAFNATQLADKDVSEGGGVTKTYLMSADNTHLSGFVKKITTTGNYVITTPYAINAGSGTGESVELDVTGTLTVGGAGLSATGNATNAATVKAGTLVSSSLALAGDNAAATITTLDMTANGTTLSTAADTSIAVTTANLSGGNKLVVNNSAGTVGITTLTVAGAGNILEVATSTQSITNLNAVGAGITFALPAAVAAGQTIVTVNTADLDNAVIGIAPQNKLTLAATESFNLLHANISLTATGINDTVTDAFGSEYDISATAFDLVATVKNLKSFEEIIDDAFNGTGNNNGNLENGASYLDEISVPGVIDPDLAKDIGDAFNDAIQAGGAGSVISSRSTQQFFGAYSAYANQALSSDMTRFRGRWQGQNRYFFNTRLFGDLSTVSADAGVVSDSGLASPRYGVRDSIACGQSRVWAGGFGTWAKQNERSNLPGYKYDSQGAVLGYEYSIGSLNLGFAAAYSRGDLKVNDLRYKNEADVLNLALYGAYIHESGFYAEGGFGYGHAWNDYKVDYIAVPGGVKKAKYGSDAFQADLELGYIARLPRDFNLIPSVGVEYTYLKNESWTESVNNAAIVANRFDSGHDNGVDIPLGLRFNKMFRFGCDSGFVVPEVRAAYVYSANKNRPSITSGFAGAPGGPKMVGVDPGRSHWRIGAGVSGRVNSRVDFRLDYEFETRSGFKGHNLNASVGLSF